MAVTTRCKFLCTETGQSAAGKDAPLHRANFTAVYGDSPENKEFFRYTPSATLSLGVVDKQHFEAGKEYYIDITSVE